MDLEDNKELALLYHYTSVEAACSITTSRSIRLYHHQTTSDDHEGNHAWRLLKSSIPKDGSQQEKEIYQEFNRRLASREYEHFYFFSLS